MAKGNGTAKKSGTAKENGAEKEVMRMVQCPDCGADGRVALVNEHAARGVEITYLCPNRRCMHYLQDIGTETLGPEREAEDAQSAAFGTAG